LPNNPASPRLLLCLAVAISGMLGCYKRHEAARPTPASEPAIHSEPARASQDVVLEPQAPDPTPASLALGPQRTPTQPGLKVAVFGDQSMRATARAVLQLIKREGADLVIHLGDLSYDEDTPAAWEAQVDAVLGPDFPYFAVIGNHDVSSWFIRNGFAQRLAARLSRMRDAHCQGEYAINASCTFRGLHFVLSGVGTYGRDHEPFLESALASSPALHNLCAWHKNQRDMQVGGKVDEVGWKAYQICAAHGTPVVTGHEHSYARTFALSAIGDRKQGHGAGGSASELLLGAGRTFVVVSGLGGQYARAWTPEHKADSWWASIYAGNYQVMNGERLGTKPNIEYGALFITYGVDGDSARASAYFKTTSDAVADQFSWRIEPAATPEAAAK
jgi:hypothetical protein